MLSLLGQAHFKGSCLPLNFLDQQSLHLAILRITLEPYKKWQRLGLFIRLIKAESFEIWECLCFKSSPGALMRNQIWETLICDMTNLDSILKSRDITLSTKVCLVKAMVFPFPVVMYGCESWTIKKDECWRIDAFELWCWRRLLRVFWTARRSNQSILKEISPGCSLERLLLKLKLQYFGHMMQRKNWQLRKDPDAGKDWRQEEKGMTEDDMAWLASLSRWTWVWVNSGSWWWIKRPGVMRFMGSPRVRHKWVTKLNWSERAEDSSLLLND